MQTIHSRLAKALQVEMNSSGGDEAWFWIEGGGFGAPLKSYLGLARQVITCRSGNETSFRKTLTSQWQREKIDLNVDVFNNGFTGGWLLALAYEFGSNADASILGASAQPIKTSEQASENPAQATALAMHVPAVIEIDRKTAVAKVLKTDNTYATNMLSSKLENILLRAQIDYNQNAETIVATPKTSTRPQEVVSNLIIPKAEYIAAVESAKSIIARGELSVLCLTNRVEVPIEESVDPLPIFLALQESSDAPRAALIEWRSSGDTSSKWIVSASPERFVSKLGDKVSSAPIKGTRKRGANVKEDSRLKEELRMSTKELTENARVLTEVQNELKSICKPGSISIGSDGHVESYKQVHQLVSEVGGTLDEESDFWEIIDALFAPASMTGVPKQKAIEAAAELEGARRGWYSGCFGLVSPGAIAVELAVTIRSLESDSKIIRIGAGGGITESSEAELEWQEVLHKSHAMLNALQNHA